MQKMTRKIVICSLLGMFLGTLGAYSNNLTQLDIKKSNVSDSTLNVTIYTNTPYDENVAVSKKAENKYVIIMPNVSSAAGTRPDLTGLGDVVSDIDVKSVQDGDSGYTKVTLTTTKPVNIRTAAKKSTPLTAEQKAYKNLIAQTRANKPVNNTITNTNHIPDNIHSTTVPAATIKFENSKPEPQKVKTQPKQEKKPLIAALPLPVVQEQNEKSVPTVKTTQDKLKSTGKSTVRHKTNSVNNSNETLERHVPSTFEEVPEKSPSEPAAVQSVNKTKNTSAVSEKVAKPVIAVSAADKLKQLRTKIENITNRGISTNMLTTFAILLCSMIGLVLLFKLIKKSLEHSLLLKQSFKENLLSAPVVVENYDDIVNDSELSWQEKYQKYIDNSKPAQKQGRRILKHIGNGEYRFVNAKSTEKPVENNNQKIQLTQGVSDDVETAEVSGSAQLKSQKLNKFKSYNKTAKNISPEQIPPIKKVKNQNLKPTKTPKLQIVEDDYKDLEESLERTLHQAPDKELFDINEEIILNQLKNNFKSIPVSNEADKIAEAMHKTKKLKSFANKMALEETKRNVPLPKSRSEIKKTAALESKHVELGNFVLHTNPRKFEGANLSVGDLIAKGSRYISSTQNRSSLSSQPQNSKNSPVTLEGFFDKKANISNSVTASASLARRVADSLGKMNVEDNSRLDKANLKAETSNPFDDKVILSGYEINSSSGFYVVRDSSGNVSLVGKIGNETTLIKDFGAETNIKLQVRPDSPNVYMVKVNGYRYLVEANSEKMGVLLEL